MSTLVVVLDPEEEGIYGFFRCQDCGSEFYGGGDAIHKRDCPRRETGYQGLEYVVGRKAFASILTSEHHLNPISADDLRRDLPEEVRRFEEQRS